MTKKKRWAKKETEDSPQENKTERVSAERSSKKNPTSSELESPAPSPKPNESPKWSDVLDAIDDSDVKALHRLADGFDPGGKTMKQHGLSIDERIQQILRIAPGKHPATGPLLRELADVLESK